MSVVTRFLFDHSFETPWPEVEPAAEVSTDAADPAPADDAVTESPPQPVYGDVDLARARAEGEAEGRARAATEAAHDTERKVAAALEGMTHRLAALAAEWRGFETAATRDALDVALAVVRKLFPELDRRSAMDEIAGVVATALALAVDKPRLVVRVAPDLLEPVSGQLAELAAASGWSGRLDVVADATLTGSDCRADWRTGGATRDTAALWREIDAAVERFHAGLDHVAPASAGAAPSPVPRPENAADERMS